MKSILLFNLMGLIVATAQPAIASEAYGDPFEGWGFVKEDWQVVCDNTLTCRAAGYQPESQYDMPASILIVAKPMQPKVSAKLNFYSESEDGLNLDAPTLWLNNKNYGAIGAEFALSPRQTEAIISHARMHTNIEIKTTNMTWQISDNGMYAVLLKLDEVQGRVGTRLALVSKNSRPQQVPKEARQKPIIQKAFAYADDAKQKLTAVQQDYFNDNVAKWVDIDSEQLIGSKEDMGDCELVNPETREYQGYESESFAWTFTPIDAKHTLASHVCWRGAYNEGHGYWLIDNHNPSTPQLITTSGNYYGDGEISASHKDRGLGDCWNLTEWTWNGETFVRSYEMTTGLCQGFAGGAWELPNYVTTVIK